MIEVVVSENDERKAEHLIRDIMIDGVAGNDQVLGWDLVFNAETTDPGIKGVALSKGWRG